MTCIVGIATAGKVFMGGDSAGVGGYDLTLQANPKVFVNDGYLMASPRPSAWASSCNTPSTRPTRRRRPT